MCPRVYDGNEAIFPSEFRATDESPIGPYKEILIARTKDRTIRRKAQYGGVVSTLIICALEKGMITSAVLTDRGLDRSPGGRLARDRKDVLECGGSRYTASGGLAALNRAIKNNEDRVSVVGLPCQMEALTRMKSMDPDNTEPVAHVSLRIGLFCTWALDYRDLKDYFRTLEPGNVIERYDIPPPPAQVFQVFTDKGRTDIPLHEIRPFIQKGCALCQDMTAEFSDISVRTVEGVEGWNTVVVRTNMGSRIMKEAGRYGILDTERLPEVNLVHLIWASRHKRERGRKAMEAMSLGE